MRVLSIIIWVLTVLAYLGGAVLLVASIVCLSVSDFRLAGWLQRLLVDAGEFTKLQVGLALLADAVLLLANGVMFTFAVLYFNTELKDGTPFTHAGAIKVRHMGIARIVATLVAAGAAWALTSFVDSNLLYSVEVVNGLFFGVALILAALIFQHGAELQAAATTAATVTETTPTAKTPTKPKRPRTVKPQ